MVADILNDLRNLADAFSEGERPTFRPPASTVSIQAFEATLGFPLPNELREFLSQCDAVVAMDVHNGYWLGGSAELTRSVSRGDFPRSIKVGEEFVAVAPVGTDGGGNAFLLTAGDGKVWRWDHENGSLAEVAGSFVALLMRVAEDWEQAAAGVKSWKYLV